jgi:hypothetical protein
MTSAEDRRRADDEAFAQGFHGIPDPRKRARMSAEKLAIELSNLEKGSPPYILIEHELNLRLAKEQAKATLTAAWLGAGATLVAVFLAAAVGYLAGALQRKEANDGPGAGAGAAAPGAAASVLKPLVPAISASGPFPATLRMPAAKAVAETKEKTGNVQAKP